MPFTLLYTRAFVKDLKDSIQPIPGLVDSLKKQLDHLAHDPVKFQSSLQTYKYDQKVHKSRIDNAYRMLWAYHGKNEILMLRAGEHDYINEDATWHDMKAVGPLDKRDWGLGNDTPAAQPAPQPTFDASKWAKPPAGPFARVPDGVLRLLGVPAAMLPQVKNAADVNVLFEIGLPAHASEVLEELYTSPDLSVEDLLLNPRVLFRETTDRLASYAKGEIKQLLLHLTPDQERLVSIRTTGPTLLKGVAGSGKTTVGLRKAMHEREDLLGLFAAPRRVLFTTYNKTLMRSVRDMFIAQYGAEQASQIDVIVLRDWMRDYLGRPDMLLGKDQTSTLKAAVDVVRQRHADSFLFRLPNSQNFIQAEIDDVFFGRGIRTWEEYRTADRAGRGVPLQEPARRVMWDIFDAYTERTARLGKVDYGDLARRCLERMQAEKFNGAYDVVVVDEAQDLRPRELEVTHRLCTSYATGNAGLILLADAAQSIYYRGVSWKDAGIKITGRTYMLKKNFRNTRQVLSAAWSMMQAGGHMAASLGDELIIPDSVQKSGPQPEVYLRSGVSGQIDQLCERVMELYEHHNIPPRDIAVLAPQEKMLQSILTRFEQLGIPCVSYKADDFGIFENGVKLITLHSAKGLEFPVVFLTHIDEGTIPWHQGPPSQEKIVEMSREENLQSWRRLFYVSMTRAAYRLYILADRAKPSQFLSDFGEKTVVTR